MSIYVIDYYQRYFAPLIPQIPLPHIILFIDRRQMTETLDLMRGFVCGAFAGWAQVWVMQPFEMIKLRLINQCPVNPQYHGILDCVRKIVREEGVTAFYKGTLSPLIGYSLQGSLAFGSNELFKKLISYIDRQNNPEKGIMPLSHVFLSGTLTGMVSACVLTPADHARILMQKKVANNQYKGSFQAILDIRRRYGFRGVYLGFGVTLLREVLGNAVYFYSYEGTMRLFAPEGQGSASADIMWAFLAGGIAGPLSWLLPYPVDYVKTKMQSQNLDKLSYRNARDCAIQQYREYGLRELYKGLGVTLIRAVPVNAVAFFSYEAASRRFGWKTE